MRVTIDGNIGSGKTTLLRHLESMGTCYFEPVEWWSSPDTENLLAKQYAEPSRWSLACQLMIAASHARAHS